MDYSRTMARLPIEELFRIANPRVEDEYANEAIAAAREELSRRNVPHEELDTVVVDQESDRVSRSDEPLSIGSWIGFILFGWFLGLGVVAIIAFLVQGRFTKATHGAIALVASIVLWGTAMALLMIWTSF